MAARKSGETAALSGQDAPCDPAYPTLCIPADSPDLDCDQVGASSFPVRGYDRHGFDADRDGIGCEPRHPERERS